MDMFDSFYVTRPNALLLMPMQFLHHGLLPNSHYDTLTKACRRASSVYCMKKIRT